MDTCFRLPEAQKWSISSLTNFFGKVLFSSSVLKMYISGSVKKTWFYFICSTNTAKYVTYGFSAFCPLPLNFSVELLSTVNIQWEKRRQSRFYILFFKYTRFACFGILDFVLPPFSQTAWNLEKILVLCMFICRYRIFQIYLVVKK